MYNINTIIDENLIDALMASAQKLEEEKNYALAEKFYLKAYELRIKVASIDPLKHRILLIDILNSLTNLYLKKEEPALGIAKQREAISYLRIVIRQTNATKYILQLAQMLNRVGDLHREYKNRQLAQYFYTDALATYALLYEEKDYSYYQIAVLNLHLNLIMLYEADHLFEHAKPYYLEAIVLTKTLIERGFNKYYFELSKLECDLGTLYFFGSNYDDAKAHYLKSLDISRSIKAKESIYNIESLAIAQNNLASIYASEKDYADALTYYNEALPNLTTLSNKNPKHYTPNLAVLFRNLASIHFYLKNIDQAEFFHFKSMEIFKEFSQVNGEKYNIELATSIVEGVEFYNQHTLTLYKAETLLTQYEANADANMLLKKIHELRGRYSKEGI